MNEYKTLVAKGNEVVKMDSGYKYVFKNAKTLVPQAGIVAKLKDYTPIDEKTQMYANVNMNKYEAYRDAMELLKVRNPEPKKITKKKKTTKKKKVVPVAPVKPVEPVKADEPTDDDDEGDEE